MLHMLFSGRSLEEDRFRYCERGRLPP